MEYLKIPEKQFSLTNQDRESLHFNHLYLKDDFIYTSMPYEEYLNNWLNKVQGELIEKSEYEEKIIVIHPSISIEEQIDNIKEVLEYLIVLKFE